MISFDLKSGYHHIDINSESQTFLGFAWKRPGDKTFTYYQFTVLPFGLCTAPFVFTKCLKPLEKYWRSLRCLDDGWLTEGSYNECMNLAIKTRADINNAGLVVNEQNSLWQPCQELDWLGLIWNSVDGTISITQSRLTRIFQTIQYLKSQKFYVSARELASFIEKIISTCAVTRNVCQIMTRHCSMSVAAAPSWDSKFNLDDYCLKEIEF